MLLIDSVSVLMVSLLNAIKLHPFLFLWCCFLWCYCIIFNRLFFDSLFDDFLCFFIPNQHRSHHLFQVSDCTMHECHTMIQTDLSIQLFLVVSTSFSKFFNEKNTLTWNWTEYRCNVCNICNKD